MPICKIVVLSFNHLFMFTKEFEIRWNDLDANMHLGNSSYIEFMSHTRMAFFTEQGIGIEEMKAYGLGPIVFYEHIYYFKEALLGTPITVSLEIAGHSEDGRFVIIEHNFYDAHGKHLTHAEMLFSWINLKTRKLGVVPTRLLDTIKSFPRSKQFKILSKEDIRKYGKRPQDLA